jgi:hypothetical protein
MTLTATTERKAVQPAIHHATATYRGKPREGYRRGVRYNVVFHRCAGSRYLHGRWVKDERVQVYRLEKGPTIMYESIEEAKKDFAM